MNALTSPSLEALGAVEVQVCVQLGKAMLPLAKVLALNAGSVVQLDCSPDAPVVLLVNGVPVATGDLVLDDEGKLAVEIGGGAP